MVVNFEGRPLYQDFLLVNDTVDVTVGNVYHAVQAVQTLGASAFTITVYGSLDGTTFSSIGTVTTSGGFLQFSGVYRYLRFTASTLAASNNVRVHYAARL